MKRRSKAQKLGDYFDAFKCIREGKKVKRSGAKDGSLATHPAIEVTPDLSEATVLKACLEWFKKRGIVANRNNTGFGDIHGTGGFYHYGLKDAGDIIGLNRQGVHFEVEVKKSNGGRLSLGQQKRMKKIQDSNGIYLVCHGVEELESWVNVYF